MAAEAPESKEVSDFRFRQLRKLKLTKGNEDVPANATNIVATCSKYGLLFIGVNDGFKVLKLENVLDLNEDKENIRSHAENYSCQKIICEAPVLLAISADDLTLAVCVTHNSNMVADMYDLRAFGDPDATPVPFLNVQLCTRGAQLRAFLWNPVVVEMYVYLLSDGSVHVHELADTMLKIVASQENVNATAVCWSPKGKQLVVGKTNGSFSQFKPTLQEVKNIAPPKLDENSIYVTSISWISTTLFAVLYAPADNKNDVPYLVFVSTPKGSPVLYTNYNDVCFGSGSRNESRYFMHYESEWGILICASTNSPDVAVVGMNKTNPSVWEQWKLDEGAEAMLPTDKTGESYPLGLGVMYCAQRKIVISDNESYSAMPVIFILSTKGLLVSFHMHNSSPLAANLVYPSEAISRDGERKRKGPPPINTVPSPQNFTLAPSPQAVAKPLQPQIDSSNQTLTSQNSMFSMSALKQNSTNQSPKLGANSTLAFPQSNQFPSFSSLTATQPVVSTFVAPPPQSFPPLQMSMFQNIAPPPPPPALTPPAPLPPPPTPSSFFTSPPQLLPSPGFLPSPENSEKIHKKPSRESSLSVITPIATSVDSGGMRPVAVAQRHLISSTKKSDIKTGKIDTYTSAIFEEINSMNAEIEDLKTTLGQTFHIGTKEEMTSLKQSSMSSEEFQTNMKNTMQSLNSDIHGLKNVLLESFVMVEDGNSRERRKNDNSYISMLKDRALDPMTAKRMQKIDQNYQYLSTQLQEVHDKLNHNYMEYEEKRKENQRLRHPIPSAEAIYRAIVHNQNTIYNLRNKTEILTKRTNQRKLQKFSRRYGQYTESVDNRDISKLADSLLQAEITPQNTENPATRVTKKLSSDKQAVLSEFLANRTISTIKPTVVYSPSQSRLLSRSQLYSKDSNQVKPKVEPGFIAREQTTREVNPGLISLASQSKASAFEKTPLFGSMSQNLQMNSSVNKNILSTQLQERPLKPENTFSAITSQSLSFKTTAENSSIPHSIVVPMTKAAVPQNTSQQNILSPQAPGYFQNMTYSTPLNTGIAPKTTSFSQAHAFSFIQARDDAQPSYSKISEAFYEDITPTDTPPYSEEDYSGEASHISEEEFNEYNQSLVSQISLEQLNERQSLNEKVLFEVSINEDGEAVAHAVTSTSQDFALSDLQQPFSSPGNTHGSLFKSFSDVQDTDDEVVFRVTKSTDVPLPTYSQSMSAKESSKQQTSLFSSGSMAVSSPTITTVKSVTSEGKTGVDLPASKSIEKTASKKNDGSSTFPGFGQSSGTLFGEKSLFGNTDSSSSKPVFGQFAASTNATSFFGPKPTSSGTTPATSSLFGQKLGTTSIIGQVSTTKADLPGLDLSTKQAPTTAAVSLSAQPDSNASVSRPVLGSVSSNGNKPVSSTGSLMFTKAESAVEPAATASSDIPQSTSSNLSDQVITVTPNDESWNKQIEDNLHIATLEAEVAIIAVSASGSQSTTSPTSDSSVPAMVVTSPSVPVSQETPVSIITTTVSSLEPVATATVPVSNSSITVTESSVQPTTTLSTTANDQPHTTTAAAPVATPSLLFGQVANSTSTVSPPLFGQSTSTTVPVFGSATTNSIFSQQASTTAASVFGQPVTTAPVFGQATSSTTASVFGQAPPATAEATSTASSLFGAAIPSAVTPSLFGQKPSEGTSSFFGQSAAATTQSSFFSKPTADPSLFGQSSTFGQPQSQTLTTSSGPFGQGSFFSQSPIGGTPSLFGSGSAGTEGSSAFGGQSAASGFSFGKSTFGQSSGTFGLAKSVFGTSSTFGQSPASAPFGQSQGGGGVFGQGSFFSGIGGKPSAENASKNVFGSGALGKPGGDSGIFGSEGASTFGSKPAGSFAGGSFSGGGGTVGETGFGSFQQSPQKTGGFGTAPAFGSSPAFGSPPAFGPLAATSSPIGGSLFGSQQSASFSNFASATSPTFGSLATQSPPSFGAAQNQAPAFGQQPQQQQGSLFGSAPVFGASSFGGQPQSSFGSPGSPSGNASAFTQWRN